MSDPRARILLLGTGAGITPKAGRQSTAAAFRCGGGTYVIDCGNGIGPQLMRARVPLESLRAIFITHHHLDHVADFGVLLAQCWSRLQAPVALLGPPPLRRMFELFLEMFSLDLQGRVAEEGRAPLSSYVEVSEFAAPGACYEDDWVRVAAANVVHPPLTHAYAFRFEEKGSGVSVVFSGDTAPTQALADFASGAQTLVHEATYPTALAQALGAGTSEQLLARMARAHSPVTDAARIAAKAGVRRLVLSPLAPATGVDDAQWIAAARREFAGEVVVGRDLLEIPL
jgi:ribonuclease BN (tRNA processing enzyme)